MTGSVLPARDQGQVGACVGFGTAAAVEHLMCVELAADGGKSHEFRPVAPEVIYGGSRVEVGGGRLREDGSVGAWAAEFVKRYGVVPRSVFGRLDLQRYSETTCRDLGRSGVPADLEAVARKHPVRGIANVRTWPEAQAAVRNGYPVAVCSRQGFRMDRDADGFCAPAGVWYHCMALVGVRGGPRPGGFLLNPPIPRKSPRMEGVRHALTPAALRKALHPLPCRRTSPGWPPPGRPCPGRSGRRSSPWPRRTPRRTPATPSAC